MLSVAIAAIGCSVYVALCGFISKLPALEDEDPRRKMHPAKSYSR